MECKFKNLIAFVALQSCTFLILAMTIDKYIAIKWPHSAATNSTPRRAKMTAASLFVCSLVYNIPHLFLSSFMGGMCIAYGIHSLITKVYSWFSFVLNAIIPFVLLIYMNFVVKTVRTSRKSFGDNNRTTGMDPRQKAMKSAENQLTIHSHQVVQVVMNLGQQKSAQFIPRLPVPRFYEDTKWLSFTKTYA